MNDKITLPALIQLLALQTGDSKKQAEDFIKSFFKEISDILAEGDSVKIRGIGIFKVIDVDARKSVNVSTGEAHEIPAHRKVVFVPDKELASAVNEPFSMFETVELPEDSEDPVSADDSEAADHQELPEDPKEELHVQLQEELQVIPDQQDLGEESYDENIDAAAEETVDDAEDENAEDNSEGYEDVAEDDEAANDSDDSDEDMNVYTYQQDESEDSPTSQSEHIVEIKQSEESDLPDSTLKREDEFPHAETPVVVATRKSRFGIGFLCGALAALLLFAVACVILFVVFPDRINLSGSGVSSCQNQTDSIEQKVTPPAGAAALTAAAVPSDTVQATTGATIQDDMAPTRPSDANPNVADNTSQPEQKKVYDTITKSRYLTTMAKDHYGNFNLWPYIYEENKAILGHPDRIKPGTQIVVPDLKKYGVDPTSPKDIAKAKRKGVEIYSRYK